MVETRPTNTTIPEFTANLEAALDSMRGKPVAIAGFGETSKRMVFDEPESVQVWGMNASHNWLYRYDVWFDLHPPGDLNSPPVVMRTDDYLPFLESCQVPVFNQEVIDWIPGSVRFPIEEVTKVAPITRIDNDHTLKLPDTYKSYYFTSTVAYMVGLAIYLEVPSISFFGIDLLDRTDYILQRPGVEFYLGIAVGKGIEVQIPTNSQLLQGPVYGREYNSYEESAISKLKAVEDRHFNLIVLANAAIGKADQFANVRNRIDTNNRPITHDDWGSVQVELDNDVQNFVGEINRLSGELREARRNAISLSGIDSTGTYRVNFVDSKRFNFTQG